MSRRSTGDVLAAALEVALSRHFGGLHDLTHTWVDWHSATFVGARHEMRLTVSPDMMGKLRTIADDDLPLSRGFVADVAVVSEAPTPDGVVVALEVLTILD